MDSTGHIREKLKQSRAFLFTFMAIAVIWVLSSMSETKVFREEYRLCFDGIDTARYVVIHRDSTLTLDITSNGFRAMNRSLSSKRAIHINVKALIKNSANEPQKISVNLEQYADTVKKQLDMFGVSAVKPVIMTAEIDVAERMSRKIAVNIDNVIFDFEEMYGLSGEPVLTPDSVTVYGSRESLDKLTCLMASRQTIPHIRKSGNYKIHIDNSWKKYSDLRFSCETVSIYIPVDDFVEMSFSIPITAVSDDNAHRVNLYPSEATVNFWVPKKEYTMIKKDDFKIVANYNTGSGDMLPLTIGSFPSNIRIKSIEPSQVQYIIIK